MAHTARAYPFRALQCSYNRRVTRKQIDSPKNPTIKELVRLRERRVREHEGRYLIEGTREVQRAVQAGVPVQELFVCAALLRLEGETLVDSLSLPRTDLSDVAFNRVSLRQNPDGVLAVAAVTSSKLTSLTLKENALVLVIDGVEKPGNIGALLRTADAADLDAVFVTGAGTDLYNPNVIRASVGSVFSRPVLAVETEELLEFLQSKNFALVATTPDAEKSYWEESYVGSSAIILGTEHEGLGRVWLEYATTRVSIPMHGLADSLNVSVSGALLIFEALRQRASKSK